MKSLSNTCTHAPPFLSKVINYLEADLNDVPTGTANELLLDDLKWRCLFDYSTSISLLWIL